MPGSIIVDCITLIWENFCINRGLLSAFFYLQFIIRSERRNINQYLHNFSWLSYPKMFKRYCVIFLHFYVQLGFVLLFNKYLFHSYINVASIFDIIIPYDSFYDMHSICIHSVHLEMLYIILYIAEVKIHIFLHIFYIFFNFLGFLRRIKVAW